jgi:hypothetical protein
LINCEDQREGERSEKVERDVEGGWIHIIQ